MAKTIEEMAEEYAEGLIMQEDALMCKAAVCYGADVVIEELEKCLNGSSNNSKLKLDSVIMVIKQLKGE